MPINSSYVLVTGGAGYIGSHAVLALKNAGFTPVVFDNLSKGHQDALRDVELIVGDIADKRALKQLFASYSFSAVMHFASYIDVAESVADPLRYYQNNVGGTLNLLDAMHNANVKRLIFSSSAAVYGEPIFIPITEEHPLTPINPYGRSKKMVESIIADYAKSTGLQYAILRYYNAAGADPDHDYLFERHEPESHLIPLLLQVARGEREYITIYGNDYSTPDGTCVRDYVHVSDLCSAHVAALYKLFENHSNLICNLGTGIGYSVQEVITAVEHVTNKPIPIIQGKRRAGDPATLIADPTLARQRLNWSPLYPELEIIIAHAWQFRQNDYKITL